MIKAQLVRAARKLMAERHPDVPIRSGCLYAAGAMIDVLRQCKVRACLQAGSASWVRITSEQDDGKCNNAFGYGFHSENSLTVAALLERRLPEMHVWVGVPSSQEIIDITTA